MTGAMFGPAWDAASTPVVSCQICGAVIANNARDTQLHFDTHAEKSSADMERTPSA